LAGTNEEHLQNTIEKVQTALVSSSESIISSLAVGQAVDETTEYLWIEKARQLRQLVPPTVSPLWLKKSQIFIGATNQKKELISFIVTRISEIKRPILLDDDVALDVEQMFTDFAATRGLDALFDRLISLLAEIIIADVLNDKTVDEALRRLQSLLRRAKRGSLATVLMTMNFGRFVTSCFSDMLKENKYTKHLAENFEEEFRRASEVVKLAEEDTKRQCVARLTNSKRLSQLAIAKPAIASKIAGFLPLQPESQEGDPDQNSSAE
jgi:hypothetical protein